MTEQPRLIKNLHADYVPAKWDGTNRSGIRVVGKTVLVLMDRCSSVSSGAGGAALLQDDGQKAGSAGVTLPLDVVERMDQASETGVLVATSPGAFLLNEDMSPWTGEKPQPGDRVYIEKYAGKLIKGRDGLTYRLMDYTSIGATYEPEENA